MAVNINVTEDENSIDINDVNVFTIHVKDLSIPGQIQISEDDSGITEDTVNTTTEVQIIELSTDPVVEVSVNEINTNTVTVITTDTNVIEVSDDIAIVTAATEAASKKLRGFTGDSLWDQFGDNAVYTEGNVGIGTTSPNHTLDVAGNVNATSFTGTFIGAISSSAQIAADISGAFADLSNTVTSNQSNISTRQNEAVTDQANISVNQANITTAISRLNDIESITGSFSESIVSNRSFVLSNLALIETQIAASASLQSRLSLVEAGSTSKTLISGSAQIATEISGAFTDISSSINARLTTIESELNVAETELAEPLISSSAQIATEISGAFTITSASLQSRLSSVEAGSTSKTLISGSGQIATEISGAFTIASESLSSRISSVEAGSTSKTLISGSAQIATEISGAFTFVSSSITSRATVLEDKVGQAVNPSSDVEFNIISASQLRVDNDTQISGDLGIGGTIFGLTGFGVTIDDLRILTGSNRFGSESINTHQFTGSVFITGSIDTTDIVTAPAFVGTFVGALSSSAQIATDISGAFTIPSSSFSSRLAAVEGGSTLKTLISGSDQIATDISGSFTATSASITSRISTMELELSNTLISGSDQIATEISGAFNTDSSSFQTRLTVVESELSNTLISSSAQINTEISGAFTSVSTSFSERITANESITANSLVSSSAQIASEISGAFKNINFSDVSTHGVVVYDNTAKQFHFTGSYGGSSTTTTGTTTQFTTSSTAPAINLTKLVINDYSDSVSVTATDGVLQLTFGNPTLPYFVSFNAIGFEPDRFNNEIDEYKLNIVYDLSGNTFVKGEVSASTNDAGFVGITTFTDSGAIDIDSNFTSYQSGSHTFVAKLFCTDTVTGASINIAETLDLQLNKSNPNDPTINFSAFNIPEDSYLLEDMEIEEGAEGSIDFQLIEGLASGWTAASPHNSSFTAELTVNATGNVSTGTIEEYWTSGTDNIPENDYTSSVSREWTRVRSLRFKTDTNGDLPTESELQDISNWSGTIKAGFNDKTEIESVVMPFTVADINGEFIFIIYDKDRGNLTSIFNATTGYEEISMFDVTTIGGYKVYKKRDPVSFSMSYRVEF